MPVVAVLASLLMCAEGLPPTSAAAVDPITNERIHVWQESLDLEAKMDLARARAILVGAWGERPDNYDVALRLGWLSLRLQDTVTAADSYRRALELRPGAADPQLGLTSVRALEDADPVLTPAVWGSYVRRATPKVRWDGWALTLGLPIMITPSIVLRTGYTHTAMGLAAAVPGVPPSWSSDDAFLALGLGSVVLGGEILGMGLFASDLVPVYGGDARLWVGDRYGLVAEGALLGLPQGRNKQLQTTAFVVPLSGLVIMAGSRFTWDPAGMGTSATGELIWGTRHHLYISGHYGTERWRVDGALPAVATFRDPSPWGGSAALLLAVTRHFEMGVQAGFQRLRTATSDGQSIVASIGMRWKFNRHREN